jgi:tetratricopeptide (TPR) repeat protein
MSTAASDLARQAFEHVDSGKLPEAVSLYRRALDAADLELDDMEMIHREFATVLSMVGDLTGALEQRRLALDAALNEPGGADSLAVIISRYFLGELLLKMEQPDEALAAIQPSLHPSKLESLLRMIEALAHEKIGQVSEARIAAKRAMECSNSESQREKLRERLGNSLDVGNG